MKKTLKKCIDAALCRSPAQPFFRWRASRRLTVLAYHGIDNPLRFEKQLNYLLKRMHPVTLDEVLNAIAGGLGLPKHAVLITFDDGDRSLLDFAMPMLRDRGVPAVAFIIAGLLDTEEPCWWLEVEALTRNGGATQAFPDLDPTDLVRALRGVNDDKRLAVLAELKQTASRPASPVSHLRGHELSLLESAGISIGNHSLTHPFLPRCSFDKLKTEIFQSHEILTATMGHPPQVFSYPNGGVDERVARVLSDLDYKAAFLFDHRLSSFPPLDKLYISRARVNSLNSLDRFRIIVSGLHPALNHIRNKD